MPGLDRQRSGDRETGWHIGNFQGNRTIKAIQSIGGNRKRLSPARLIVGFTPANETLKLGSGRLAMTS